MTTIECTIIGWSSETSVSVAPGTKEMGAAVAGSTTLNEWEPIYYDEWFWMYAVQERAEDT